ncbi:LPXTG cell wall anchor domain-containing protein [Asanoa iriomotensis]|uniref:LPXTG-motif cell wall-anchored protein n=1 Tax=Asanoa iriomotensis TaxID=234613 RepID=A0ABQ4C6Y3_9ACTN|nr:LPXTG cell wall anchor domain-containing protein [Asanoa iriomotensis]GIF58509.1 hypothetical protein Air01nite_46040 [Asanoa iriomotensis]
MRLTPARRLLAGIGVVGALVATGALPAAAAPTAKLGLYMPDHTVAVGAPGVIDGAVLYADEPTALVDAAVIFDFADLAGVAEVVPEDGIGPDCTKTSAHELRCTRFETWADPFGAGGDFNVVIRGVAGGPEGTGTLKTTLEVSGYDSVTTESTVRVGTGVDLAGGPDTDVSVAPGGAFSHHVSVKNAGDATIEGFNAIFDNNYAIRAAKKFTNCTYVGDELRTCAFDVTIEPGETFQGDLPYRLGADTEAPGHQVGFLTLLTRAEFEDFSGYVKQFGADIGKPGTDGTFELTAAPANLARRGAQADVDPENNWSGVNITVTGKNGYDLVAAGARITGNVGDVADVDLGFRNDGPAAADSGRLGSNVTLVDVTVPKGTTVVEVSDQCVPKPANDAGEYGEPGEPGAPVYRCFPGDLVTPGETVGFPFRLRIDQAQPERGLVTINAKCECEGRQSDINSANDTAPIEVNAAGGGTGGGGDDGGLPITGPAAGLIAGAGGLLLVAGLGGVVVAWRRRTRFVA